MKPTHRLILSFLLPLTSIAADKDTSPAVDQEALAKRLIIPKLIMREASPGDVYGFLQKKSKDLDPDKKGVNIVLWGLDPVAPNKAGEPPPAAPLGNTITYSLDNVSVLEAALQAAKQAKLEVTARKDGIFIHAKGKRPPPPRP